MKFLILNGPNLNMLGIREPEHYGRETYDDVVEKIRAYCGSLGIETEFYQSNHEGALVDRIQAAYGDADGIVINPRAYTHTLSFIHIYQGNQRLWSCPQRRDRRRECF